MFSKISLIEKKNSKKLFRETRRQLLKKGKTKGKFHL